MFNSPRYGHAASCESRTVVERTRPTQLRKSVRRACILGEEQALWNNLGVRERCEFLGAPRGINGAGWVAVRTALDDRAIQH